MSDKIRQQYATARDSETHAHFESLIELPIR
jgi:hypothetical protein